MFKELSGRVYDVFVSFNYNSGVRLPAEYSVQLLWLIYFYMEFVDAIREGDGGRVLKRWKYRLPIFSGSGNRIMFTMLQISFCSISIHYPMAISATAMEPFC